MEVRGTVCCCHQAAGIKQEGQHGTCNPLLTLEIYYRPRADLDALKSGMRGQSGTPCSMNMRGHLCPSKRASSCGPMQDGIALGLLGKVEIKLVQISSAWLLPAQQ